MGKKFFGGNVFSKQISLYKLNEYYGLLALNVPIKEILALCLQEFVVSLNLSRFQIARLACRLIACPCLTLLRVLSKE